MNGKKWIRVWFAIIMIIPIVGMFNYLIDPYGLNSNKNKFYASLASVNKPNITKLKINLGADYYLIGTSRVMRVNPNIIEKYLPNKKVYNINIMGATFRENSMLADKVIENGHNMIYGFDAFSLNKSRFTEDKITNRYKSFKEAIESKNILSEYFSMDFLMKSIKDVIKRILGRSKEQFAIYENTKDSNISLADIRKKLDLTVQEKKSVYTDFETVSQKDIIHLAKIATKDDLFIIYPKHFYYYILFQKYQNIEEKYFNAIKVLVKNTEAKVWSFYQINTITTSEKNFDKDGWHFKPKVADLIFAKIFEDKSIKVPNNFGMLLTKKNVDYYLENLKEEIQNFDYSSYRQ